MLELIMVLSAYSENIQLIVVGALLLVINAVLGFMQESRAAGVVEALRKRLQVNARVRRDSSWQVIPHGNWFRDIVRVRPGDIILEMNFSGALTVTSRRSPASRRTRTKRREVLSSGLSSPGRRQRRGDADRGEDLLWPHTELVQEARRNFTSKRWWRKSSVGSSSSGPLLGVVIVLSLIRGTPLLEMVRSCSFVKWCGAGRSPRMFTVSMASDRRLAKRGVLVTRLSAAEDAATMDVSCVDKTGTIT